MMSYSQEIYDAVRSRISNGDIGSAVENAIRDLEISHNAHMVQVAIEQAAREYERPSVVFRPKLYADGDQWCALFGENLQEGVAGFGETPAKAMWAFDKAWLEEKTPDARLPTPNREEA